jgi:hypothetical protein
MDILSVTHLRRYLITIMTLTKSRLPQSSLPRISLWLIRYVDPYFARYTPKVRTFLKGNIIYSSGAYVRGLSGEL